MGVLRGAQGPFGGVAGRWCLGRRASPVLWWALVVVGTQRVRVLWAASEPGCSLPPADGDRRAEQFWPLRCKSGF